MNREKILQLSLISGLGPAKIEALLAQLSIDQLGAIDCFSAADFQRYGLSLEKAQQLVDGLQDRTLLEQELQLLEKHNISWFTLFDDQYPALLKEIHLPPPIIYVQGSTDFSEQALAFVGSRATSSYGKKVVQTLVPELVAQAWTIVSGGAYGIDTVAHQATLDAGGKTVVVLGSGLLQKYPADNKKLFESIIAHNGSIVSSFPLMMQPLPHNFPARNRIISGISQGSIIVRAAEKSGALITAHYALQQGRRVFAVPGLIDDPLSAGCHDLLRKGAILVDSANAIFEEFGQKDQKVHQKALVFTDPLVALCQQPKTVDELLILTDLTENKLNDRLFELQLEGKLQQNFIGLWQSL
ncbi:DNA-protecting protein DprA [bacterium]|nr:DNA-protecting protein DprA [bacterium]